MSKEIKKDFAIGEKAVVEGLGIIEFIEIRRPDHIADTGKLVSLGRFLPDLDFDYSDFEHGGNCTLLGC